MNRRTFIHAAGAAGVGLTGGAAAGEPQRSLLKLLEDSPRERVPAGLVGLIRGGLRHEELLAALSLAATRTVQPRPNVGFKYHAVMMLSSIQATTQHLTGTEQWLPLIWAADQLKDAQAQERSGGGWHLRPGTAGPSADPASACRALAAALDRWDHEAADAAVVSCTSPGEVFAVLFLHGARDLRSLGHKAITVSNAHRLVRLLGPGEPSTALLRSAVAALLNSEGDPDPATHDLAPDRPWRQNRGRLPLSPRSWKKGHEDPGARAALRAALYRASTEEAGGAVVEAIRHGLPPGAIWQLLFDMAAEILLHRPGIVAVHAQTTVNALHHGCQACGEGETQQLLLLQAAAFIALFRQMTGTAQSDVDLATLTPLPSGPDALGEMSADLAAGRRLAVVRRSLGYLMGGGDAGRLVETARHHLVQGAEEAHDYKLAEAVFENAGQFPDPAWRARHLSAGMACFKGPTLHPGAVVAEALQRLQA